MRVLVLSYDEVGRVGTSNREPTLPMEVFVCNGEREALSNVPYGTTESAELQPEIGTLGGRLFAMRPNSLCR